MKNNRVVNFVRRNKSTIAVTVVATSVIVWQHKCIMEALEIINEAGLQDQIQ